MHKNAMKCNKTQSKWCINKHGASKIIDTFEMYQLSPTGSINLSFITEGRLAVVLIIPSSWGSQRAVTYKPSSNFSGAVAGEKEDFSKGSFSCTIFYFVFVLLYFTFACIIFIKNTKK
jgi:hypothetical protein